ncbi:MarR family transcriptional regulator [Streptomyces sp. HB2AG]|uniref:MarR family transcriptional regulator n=1 Tax=Streptomyces sp. HB2AG TaxID=2983400 RepID=UPI0022AB2E6E|nr:MarR family transcriptional regulator [Streptomyces sp. HB2AG]MCZ2527179.1 MarR family transcriptional regulator [Streptomyces sp. HB2AG]
MAAPHHPAPNAVSDQEARERVLVLHARMEKELAHALRRRHGIGLSEHRALELLAHSDDGELRMQEPADRIGLGQSSVTRPVARLEAAGFAFEDLCPSDGRGVYAVLTEEGRSRCEAARATYAEALSSAPDSFAADPAHAPTAQALRAAGS